MAELDISITVNNGDTIIQQFWNTAYSEIETWLNNRYNGTDTWSFMKVSSSGSNPVDITSSASTTELSLNNTASDGDDILTFKFDGTQFHVIGVDDSDSKLLKFGTTSLTTSVSLQIPSTGSQVQFSSGSVGTPSISAIGDSNTGLYFSAADIISVSCGGTQSFIIDTSSAYHRDGLVGTPGMTFIADSNTGFYRPSADSIGASAGGVLSLRIDSTSSYFRDGVANTPGLCFISDDNTGMWRPLSDTLGFAAGGLEAARFDNSSSSGQTRFLVFDVDNNQMERVTVGAADSGGSGFKVLRIPN